MKECCETKGETLAPFAERPRTVLWIVLLINLAMFFVEFISGMVSHSSALNADALDMLGDSAVYAFSLYALSRSLRWKSTASLLKGLMMLSFGTFVLWQVIGRVLAGSLPVPNMMGIIGTLALLANVLCAYLLYRYRAVDSNMHSTWLCSRNDVIANAGVLVGALLVSLTHSLWPDAIIGIGIALLILKSAFSVISDSWNELKCNQ